MAMGHAMRLEQPDSQTAGLSGPRGPSKTVPEEVLELWASLPRHKRQRRRWRYFCDQAVRCSRPVSTESLSTIDACVKILEDALAEFVHATAASIPAPPTPQTPIGANDIWPLVPLRGQSDENLGRVFVVWEVWG